MYLYVELWKARPAWPALSRERRGAWMGEFLAGLQGQLRSGVEVLGFARSDADTPLSAGYDFLAAWRMPSRAAAEGFERLVEGAGWHEYFEQINARGDGDGGVRLLARRRPKLARTAVRRGPSRFPREASAHGPEVIPKT